MLKLIFILGIDALDYELVEKLNLNNLKQLDYGKIIVPINEKIGVPSSPEVWASFLIGEQISMNFSSSSRYINAMKKILDIFHMASDNRFRKKVNNFWEKFSFGSAVRFGSLKRETFLDIINSNEINVPYYSFDYKTFEVSQLFGRGKLTLAQAINNLNLIYEDRKMQIISYTNEINDYDLVFAFMHTTDVLQHLLFLHVSDIEKHYIDLDNYILVLKRKLEDSFGDVIFIIVSDHGFDFEIGTHSMKGFYSSNINLIPRPKNITDFYGIILDIVKNRELI